MRPASQFEFKNPGLNQSELQYITFGDFFPNTPPMSVTHYLNDHYYIKKNFKLSTMPRQMCSEATTIAIATSATYFNEYNNQPNNNNNFNNYNNYKNNNNFNYNNTFND